MADTPERPLTSEAPPTVTVPESGGVDAGMQEAAPRPETFLERLEKHQVQVRADDFQQPVIGDQGQQLTTPIPSTGPTITVPANQVQILEWAKGPEDKALTWLSRYWIRLIKKSVHFGWRLVMPPPPAPEQQMQAERQAQIQSQQVQPVQPMPQAQAPLTSQTQGSLMPQPQPTQQTPVQQTDPTQQVQNNQTNVQNQV